MRPEWLWDRNISIKQIQNILKNPQGKRFVEIAALFLSRNNVPKEVFDQYLDKIIFVQHWSRIKRQMRKDAWNDPRIIFWQAVYKKLVSEFQKKGMATRPEKEEQQIDELSRQIAEKIKSARQETGLTQNKLADKIGISQQIISRIEKGRTDLRLLTLEKIARGLGRGVRVEWK